MNTLAVAATQSPTKNRKSLFNNNPISPEQLTSPLHLLNPLTNAKKKIQQDDDAFINILLSGANDAALN